MSILPTTPQVQEVPGLQWDPEIVTRDWNEKVLPHLNRTGILPALFAENPDEEMLSYVHRPVIAEYLKGTVFEEVLTKVPEHLGIKLNRAVFIYIPAGMCLRHHNDPDNKYHLSVVENPGSFYYDYDRKTGAHLPADGKIRQINSEDCHHTAVNGGVDARIHLVMTEYECDDLQPKTVYHSKMTYDYSGYADADTFTGKRDIDSTIEQNFMMPLDSFAYHTRKVYKLSAASVDNRRTYYIQWTDYDTMMAAFNSEIFWETQEVLNLFNIKLSYEID